MKNLLNKMVEVNYSTGSTITGKVVDINSLGDVIWVETNKDLHKATTQDIIKEVVIPSTLEEDFEAFLNANKIKWEGYGETGSTFYQIEGNTYTLQITISEDGFHHCETTHKMRYYRESDILNTDGDINNASANCIIRKTLKGVKSYVKLWVSQ